MKKKIIILPAFQDYQSHKSSNIETDRCDETALKVTAWSMFTWDLSAYIGQIWAMDC